MGTKEKAAVDAVVSDSEELKPWQHGDKPVIYIHPFYWDSLSVDAQTDLQDNYRVQVTSDLPAPTE